jgi:hypothetical protein
MTVAPVTVDAPAVRPPLGGLLPVADITDTTDGHFLFGLEYLSFLCEDGGYVAGCVDAPAGVPVDAVKEFAGSHIVSGVPVTVYAGVECDLFGAPYDRQALDRLAGSEDRLVAAAFYRHAALGAWNAGEAEQVLAEPVTQDNVVAAIAALEQYAGETYAGQPVLHMNRATATYAIAADVVVPNIDGTLATLQGTPVANSAGYPDGVIFITGAVQLWRTPVGSYQAPNTATNTSMALAERTYVMATDCLLAIAGGDDNGLPPDSLDLFVPSPIAVTVDEPTIYTTRLVNTGGPVDEATEVIRLHSTDRALTADDVTYQTEDDGTWTTVDWFETEGDLVYTEMYPVPAGLNASSRVRITVNAEDLTNLTGSSLITGDFGAVLASESYVYDISAAPPPVDPPTITAVEPAQGPLAGGVTVTVTGTGFEV